MRSPDFVEVPLKFRKVGLGKGDAELDDVVGRCWRGLGPSTRGRDAFLDLVCAVLGRDGDRSRDEGEDDAGRERPHCWSGARADVEAGGQEPVCGAL